MPRVSVIMSVYNDDQYVGETVESILAQTFEDFEFLIVNDGSSDRTTEVLDRFDDPRIVRIENETNIGLTRSLNRGLQMARGEYIARIDSNDIAEPDRFAAQVAYLDARPQVTVLGTWFRSYDEQGDIVGDWNIDASPDVLAWRMSIHNVLAHVVVMMRRDAILALGGYDADVRYAQDYDLWVRVLMAGGSIAILPQYHVRVRVIAGGISVAKRTEQKESAVTILHRYVEWCIGEPVARERVAGMFDLYNGRDVQDEDHIGDFISLARRIQVLHMARCDHADRRQIDKMASDLLMDAAIGRTRCHPTMSASLTAAVVRHAPGRLLAWPTWKQVIRLLAAPVRRTSYRAAC